MTAPARDEERADRARPDRARSVRAATLRAAGLTWSVRPGYQAWVREVLAPAADPADLPAATLIKRNRVRAVARVEGPQGPVYVKWFWLRAPGRQLLHALRASPARREERALRALRAAGLACPEPVARGEARRFGALTRCVVVTRAVDESEPLPERLERLRASGDDEPRRALVTALARAAQAGFAAGLDHRDLHVGNYLVTRGGELVVLDLHAAAVRRSPLRAGRALAGLGKLAHSLGLHALRGRAEAQQELTWLCAAYAALDPRLGDAEALGGALRQRAARLEATRLRSRGARCLRASTQFAVEGPRGRRVYRRRALPPEAVEAALVAPVVERVHVHTKGRSLLDAIDPPASFTAGGLAVPAGGLLRKRYLFPKARQRLTGAYAQRALRAWQATRACELRAVPVARVFALVLRGWPLPAEAVLLMERLPGDHLERVLRERPPAPAARRRLARDYGALIGRFHATGLTHRDLAPQNVVARPRPAPSGDDGRAGWDLWLVDLDDVAARPMTRSEKLRALTHLADTYSATRTDRARFWRAYLTAGGAAVLQAELAAWGARGLAARVAERVAQRAAQRAARRARQAAARPPALPTGLPGPDAPA